MAVYRLYLEWKKKSHGSINIIFGIKENSLPKFGLLSGQKTSWKESLERPKHRWNDIKIYLQ
jgi:hypothetical protein